MILPGRVSKATERYVLVGLSDTVSGQVPLTELADDYAQANPTVHNKNDIVRVCVIDIDAPNKKVTLSLRPSRVLSSSLPVEDPSIMTVSQLKVNDIARGFVKNVAEKGLFVSLGPQVTAFVRISDLSDSYIKEWRSAFEIDQLVKGKIIAVDADANHVQMNLKTSVIDKDYVPPLTFNDLAVGNVVTGKVRKAEDYGVFIVVDNSNNVSGLCHRSEIADDKIEDVRKLYEEGDVVKAMVLKVDLQKRRVNFGLKASYFEERLDEEGEHSDDEVMGGVTVDGELEDVDEDDDVGGVEVDLDDIPGIESDEDAQGDSSEHQGTSMADASAEAVNGLTVGSFDWTGETLDAGDAHADENSDLGDGEPSKKKKKRRKHEPQVDKTGEMDQNRPRSVADFERHLLSEPNNSVLWIEYMAFQIELGEVDRAREIAERALNTIHILEQGEKLNVWTALLNLENAFGSDESLEEVFKRACQYNDTQEVHLRLANIYIESGKNDVSPATSLAPLHRR